MIDFLRNFLGQYPTFQSVYDIPKLFEYFLGAMLLMVVVFSIYSIFGNIINFLRK